MRAQFVRGGDPKEILDIGISALIKKRNLDIPVSAESEEAENIDKAIKITLDNILKEEDFYRLVFCYEEPEEETKMAEWIIG